MALGSNDNPALVISYDDLTPYTDSKGAVLALLPEAIPLRERLTTRMIDRIETVLGAAQKAGATWGDGDASKGVTVLEAFNGFADLHDLADDDLREIAWRVFSASADGLAVEELRFEFVCDIDDGYMMITVWFADDLDLSFGDCEALDYEPPSGTIHLPHISVYDGKDETTYVYDEDETSLVLVKAD